MSAIGLFGTGPYGLGTYGGTPTAQFQLVSAFTANPNYVVLYFNAPVDTSWPYALLPSNYNVSNLTILRVLPHPTNPNALVLQTSLQDYQQYAVTLESARSLTGLLIDETHRTASFTGYNPVASVQAVALAANRVRLIFSHPMLADQSLLDPAGYTVQSIGGVYAVVTAITPEQPTDPISVVLTLATELTHTMSYKVLVGSTVRTVTGLSPTPPWASFDWVVEAPTVSVDTRLFSGEVRGGLLGEPDGMVFFSPALEAPLSNSAIEVDEVTVCTTAYDSYVFPTLIDPFPLFTWQPTRASTYLNDNNHVLWAAFPRLMEARLNLSDFQEELVVPPEDGPATAELRLTWDPEYVSILNSTAWELFPASPGVWKYVFRTASNLAPFPPVPSTVIVLEP